VEYVRVSYADNLIVYIDIVLNERSSWDYSCYV